MNRLYFEVVHNFLRSGLPSRLMIPTPNLSHLSAKDYQNVYEPAEDTFLLLDALEQDAELLRTSKPRVALEIGSGSGCVTAFLGAILGSSCLYIATDINSHACRCTHTTGTHNSIEVDPVLASFANPFCSRLRHNVDLIVFNPPYVPTLQDEAEEAQKSKGVDAALSGGVDGMEVTNKFLDEVQDYLSANGLFYLVAVKQNNIGRICEQLSQRQLHGEVIIQRRAGREHLHIVRFRRR